jgi:hypothetical protein
MLYTECFDTCPGGKKSLVVCLEHPHLFVIFEVHFLQLEL